MSTFEKNMEEIFDVTPIEKEKQEIVEVKPTLPTIVPEQRLSDELDADYLQSRKTYHDLVKKGNDAIDHLLGIATETEHPRAFEVVATLIKNTADANEKLMNLQKQVRELKGLKSREGSVNVDKAIFVGSTAELSKLIKGKND